jgi:hypothetical protein
MVLLLSGCTADDSASPGQVVTTLEPIVETTRPVVPAGRTTMLTLSAPAPGSGVGLIDGNEVRLVSVTGEVVAVGDARGFYVNDPSRPVGARVEGASVTLKAEETARVWVGAPFAQDCTGSRSEQRGRSVAVCGAGSRPPDRIDVADSGGVRTLIQAPSRGPLARPVGHWRGALLSPDGGRVLAQWSGECEVPTAYFIDTATGAARPVTGPSDGGAPNSIGLMWADDRTALAVLPEGACGEGTQPAGLYAVADGQSPRLIHRARGQFPGGFSWRLAQ